MDDIFARLAANRGTLPEHHKRPYLWMLILLFLLLMVLAVGIFSEPTAPVATGTVTPTPSREPRVYTVIYRSGIFSPTNLRIRAGDTVRFRNDTASEVRIVADLRAGQQNPEFDSIGPIPTGGTFSYTFAKVGLFGYHDYDDENHTGVIIVRE